MYNATIQNVMLDRRIFDGEPSESTYRQYDYTTTSYFALLDDPNSYARSIWHEAQRFDVLVNAHAENAARVAPLARWEDALLEPVEGAPFDQDMQAALVQADLLSGFLF